MFGGTSARTADAGRANEESVCRLGRGMQKMIIPSEKTTFERIECMQAITKLINLRRATHVFASVYNGVSFETDIHSKIQTVFEDGNDRELRSCGNASEIS
jgi:hypothetical protein